MSDSHTNVSSSVQSAQAKSHPRLEAVVRRHCQSPWRIRLHQPTVTAFALLQVLMEQNPGRALVLDSGCGTGESTLSIATAHPECWVIGIDQSSKRLEKTGANEFPYQLGNAIWIRAELASFWWLAFETGWKLSYHYILYPNPWPKPGHLRRRWHGHPVFPTLVGLGGKLELRCNWKIYAQEFATAIEVAASVPTHVDELTADAVSSPFERKYRNSGLSLYQLRADLNPAANISLQN